MNGWNGQRPFQEPKMEVPIIYKAYVRAMVQGIYPQNMAKHMVRTYLHFRILEIPLKWAILVSWFSCSDKVILDNRLNRLGKADPRGWHWTDNHFAFF